MHWSVLWSIGALIWSICPFIGALQIGPFVHLFRLFTLAIRSLSQMWYTRATHTIRRWFYREKLQTVSSHQKRGVTRGVPARFLFIYEKVIGRGVYYSCVFAAPLFFYFNFKPYHVDEHEDVTEKGERRDEQRDRHHVPTRVPHELRGASS